MPSLGREDADFAAFSFQYSSYMQLYDHGALLGNDDEQKREKDKKVFALLSLLTKDNARAQAFLVRYKRDEEAANRTLSGDDAFKKMDAMFQPKVDQGKSKAVKDLRKAMQNVFDERELSDKTRSDAIVKVQHLMNDCMHLDCTPDEKQMVIDFLGYMPEDGAWGVRKAMWLESEIASVADLLEKIRAADCAIGASDKEKGARAFVGKTQYKICNKYHLGKCRFSNRGRSSGSDITCFKCGEKDHIARDCPNKHKAGYHTSKSDDDNSDLDEETLKKAARQLKKRRSIGSKQVFTRRDYM